jgi:SAM-dependent methyltransferase
MKESPILLRNKKSDSDEVYSIKPAALKRNMNEMFKAFNIAEVLISPKTNKPYTIETNGDLKDFNGKIIKVINGIPDLTIYSQVALDEKDRQAAYHDDEEINEKFDEIVLRPYNHTEFHANTWMKHLDKMAVRIERISGKSISDMTILNCGCGGGFEAQYFAEKGAKVIGFDISQLRAEASATRFALNNLEGFFYRGEAAILPFADDTFDLVLYHASLHHVPIEDIPIAIREARRVTKGYIMLFEPHDSPVRAIMESFGFSITVESSGNYAFRLKQILMQFWCYRFGMKLKAYDIFFERIEHDPGFYAKPVIGKLLYYTINFVGRFLKMVGNEVIIIMEKTQEIKYNERKTKQKDLL